MPRPSQVSLLLSSLFLVTVIAACSEESPAEPEPPGPDPSLGFVSISAGNEHVCGLETRGYAYCWGRNHYGQLGDGTTTNRLQPTLVSDELRFRSIGAGHGHSCGITTGDEVMCWGDNNLGQLGDGTRIDRSTPGVVPGDRRFVSLAVALYHSCAVTTDGQTYCWGGAGTHSDFGALGGPAPETCQSDFVPIGPRSCSTIPIRVAGNHNFESITAGYFYGCGLTGSGDAYCWGDNRSFQLGNGNDTSTSHPVAVAGSLTFDAVEGGGIHACGIAGGAGYCWGARRLHFGQLGNGTEGDGSAIPSPVVGGIAFRALGPSRGNTYSAHTCGVVTDGSAYCWGINTMGQLGTVAGDDCYGDPCTTVPLLVDGGLSFESVTAGKEFTCAIATSRAVYCWGWNEHGQLGNGTTLNAAAPVAVVIS